MQISKAEPTIRLIVTVLQEEVWHTEELCAVVVLTIVTRKVDKKVRGDEGKWQKKKEDEKKKRNVKERERKERCEL